jgi:hypothetical protein
MSMIASKNPYGTAPSSHVTEHYNPYESVPLAPTNTTTVTTMASSPYSTSSVPLVNSSSTGSTLPKFSKALDVPPSTTPATYGYSNCVPPNTCYSSAHVATAYPLTGAGHAPGKPGMSLVNSMTYQGGPTNGLVSEGNPTKCHKVDYEIKGHEMQLVEYVFKSI